MALPGLGGQQMANGARIHSAVMFVQELDRSVSFYEDILGLKPVSRDATAALLMSPAGSQLILRAMGSNAAHPLGNIGFQYVIWSAADRDELSRSEQALRARSALRDSRSYDDVTVVEGRDPDDIAVMITYPGPDKVPLRELPTRIYGW